MICGVRWCGMGRDPAVKKARNNTLSKMYYHRRMTCPARSHTMDGVWEAQATLEGGAVRGTRGEVS